MDAMWWRVYGKDVAERFGGFKYTYSDGVPCANRARIGKAGNSGAGAILLAQSLGAAKVILVGYDGAKDGNKAHWHKDHPNGLPNAGVAHLWPQQFADLKKQLSVKVVNCSRKTAISAFDTGRIADHLC